MSMSSGGFSELSADREDVSGLPEPDEVQRERRQVCVEAH
jgi:hypothetical protein